MSIICMGRYGISGNADSVLRSVFYKYLHPKEVHIGEGVLVPDLARKKVNKMTLNLPHPSEVHLWSGVDCECVFFRTRSL